MKTQNTDPHRDIRDALHALCAQFPAEYHRKADGARGYPEEFVDALTRAGWMAALIPEDSTNLILSYIAEHVLGLPRSF